MKYLPAGLIALLLAGAVASCLLSHRLYGQNPYAVPQGGAYQGGRPDAVQVWREAAAMGLSYNEALAVARLRANSTVPTPLHPRLRAGGGVEVYQPGVRQYHGVPIGPQYSSTQAVQPISKPFEGLRPAPSAFERYWPLLLEGREDPKTGVVIWSIP